MTQAKLTRDSFHVFQANAKNALKQMNHSNLLQDDCVMRARRRKFPRVIKELP